jgi:hypothetical protein
VTLVVDSGREEQTAKHPLHSGRQRPGAQDRDQIRRHPGVTACTPPTQISRHLPRPTHDGVFSAGARHWFPRGQYHGVRNAAYLLPFDSIRTGPQRRILEGILAGGVARKSHRIGKAAAEPTWNIEDIPMNVVAGSIMRSEPQARWRIHGLPSQ